MKFQPSLLFKSPEINPLNKKARSIPALNPVNVYGRVFNFAWFGFFVAFWSWYAFPPLLNDVVAKDLKLSKTEINNSNIIALVATLLVRLVAGTCCDRFGARKTFAGTLLLGAIPTFCAGGITGPAGLYAVRFFIGILGGSFVPCQVWTTGFFDKNVVGTANALTAGFGNSGGGVTYFVMPAVYQALVGDGLTKHVAWRVSFIVPGVIIVATAVAMLILCPDTPTGKWSDRDQAVNTLIRRQSVVGPVDIPGQISVEKARGTSDRGESPNSSDRELEKKNALPASTEPANLADDEAHLTGKEVLETAKGEVIRKPTVKEVFQVCTSPSSLVVAACYFCTFGTELSVNSILGTYYAGQFKLSLQESGNWAAMFGLLNVVSRPLGGFVADVAYRSSGSLWAKKAMLHSYGIIAGAFLIAIGVLNSKDKSTMFGLVAGMAFFLEGGNGINFALVPHVHPYANGVVSGLTGASGNFGGVIFAIIFRELGKDYGKAIWIIGVITIAVNLAVCWIRPISKHQIEAH